MLDKLTRGHFEAVKGEEFALGLEDGRTLAATLTEVDTIISPASRGGRGHDPESVRDESFALIFRAPHEPPLNQGMYSLAHPRVGELPGVFLVPVAEDRDGRYYEAVFN